MGQSAYAVAFVIYTVSMARSAVALYTLYR